MNNCKIFEFLLLWSLVLPLACSPTSLVLSSSEAGTAKAQAPADASPDGGDRSVGEPSSEASPCPEVQTREASDELCGDGLDNDCDGETDCDDSSCRDNSCVTVCANQEHSDATCADGQDNDGNGYVDCDDYSCSLNPAVTVCPYESDCADGRDNDGDGHRDCDDWDCQRVANSPCSCPSSGECDDLSCSDGLDNDGNGFVDCRDWDCSRNHNVTVCEGTNETCSDGLDNDGNGFADCADFSCQLNSAVTVCCPSISSGAS